MNKLIALKRFDYQLISINNKLTVQELSDDIIYKIFLEFKDDTETLKNLCLVSKRFDYLSKYIIQKLKIKQNFYKKEILTGGLPLDVLAEIFVYVNGKKSGCLNNSEIKKLRRVSKDVKANAESAFIKINSNYSLRLKEAEYKAEAFMAWKKYQEDQRTCRPLKRACAIVGGPVTIPLHIVLIPFTSIGILFDCCCVPSHSFKMGPMEYLHLRNVDALGETISLIKGTSMYPTFEEFRKAYNDHRRQYKHVRCCLR